MRILTLVMFWLICCSGFNSSARAYSSLDGLRVHRLLPVADGLLAAGEHDHHFVVLAFNPDGQVNSGFAQEGMLKLGLGQARDLVAVEDGFVAIGHSDYLNVVIRFDASGQLQANFGQAGLQSLTFEPRVLSCRGKDLLVVGAGHHGFHWQTLDINSGEPLARAQVTSPNRQTFRYWYSPTLLIPDEDGWLVGTTLTNSHTQRQAVFRLLANQTLDGHWGQQGLLSLPALETLWGLHVNGTHLSVLGQSALGNTWLQQFDSDAQQQGEPSRRLWMDRLNITAARVQDGQVIVADDSAGESRLWDQSLDTLGQDQPRVTLFPGTLTVEQIESDEQSLWFAGHMNEHYLVGQINRSARPVIEAGLPHIRSRRSICANVFTGTVICTGNADCGINDGLAFMADMTNIINNNIETNFSTKIRSKIDTTINTMVKVETNFQTEIDTTVETTMIARNHLDFESSITSDLSGELGTAKYSLKGKFKTDLRLATAEVDAKVSGTVVTGLYGEMEGLSTRLEADLSASADLKAKATGARASVSGTAGTAASGGALAGMALGTLGTLGLIGCKVMVNKALCSNGCNVWGTLQTVFLTAVLGPCGTLIQWCRR